MSTHGRQFLPECKIVIVGTGGVGKSMSVIQFVMSEFIEDYDPVIEDSYRKQFIVDNEAVMLDILDTAGQERNAPIIEQFMCAMEGFLLVYSITSRSSFEDISYYRQKILRMKELDSFPMVVVANKSDLENERQVSAAEGQELAKQWNCKFIEISAKYRINVDEAFSTLVEEIRKYSATPVPVDKKPKSSWGKTKGNGKCLIL